MYFDLYLFRGKETKKQKYAILLTSTPQFHRICDTSSLTSFQNTFNKVLVITSPYVKHEMNSKPEKVLMIQVARHHFWQHKHQVIRQETSARTTTYF